MPHNERLQFTCRDHCDLRERIVIVDALLIERMDPKPDDPFIVLKSDRDIANDIFDEAGLS